MVGKETGSVGGTLGWGKDGRRRDFRLVTSSKDVDESFNLADTIMGCQILSAL